MILSSATIKFLCKKSGKATIEVKRLTTFATEIFKGLLVCFLRLKERTCKTRKNIFYFTSEALVVL